MFRRTVAASLLGLAAVTTVGATAADAQAVSVPGVLACTDKFVDTLNARAWVSCVA